MSEVLPNPSLLNIDFEELYQRHLCRHSQFLLNVLHLLVVLVVYFCIIAMLDCLLKACGAPNRPAIIVGIALPYLLVIGKNVPWHCFLASVSVIALLIAAQSSIPSLPWFVYPIIAVIAHRFQQWHHRFFHLEKDMTEFNRKYIKGLHLFLMLSLYELPILLNYLLFRRADWVR